jgi:hypothetical protein
MLLLLDGRKFGEFVASRKETIVGLHGGRYRRNGSVTPRQIVPAVLMGPAPAAEATPPNELAHHRGVSEPLEMTVRAFDLDVQSATPAPSGRDVPVDL